MTALQFDDDTLWHKVGIAVGVALTALVTLIKRWFPRDTTGEKLAEIQAGIDTLRELREAEPDVAEDIGKLVSSGLAQAQQITRLDTTVKAHGEQINRIENRLNNVERY